MSIPSAAADSQPTLQFNDAAGARSWVERLPLTNVQHAQRLLAEQLALLNEADVPALERFNILESLREAITFVQEESANRYAGKPLPLEENETAVWTSVMELWRQTGLNYRQCLEAYRDGNLAIAPHAAQITARCLSLIYSRMLDRYRIYREPPEILWRELNELYAFAEQHGFARIRVEDSTSRHDAESSCADVYAQALLTQLASPYALSARQLDFVQRWSAKWASLVGFSLQPLPPGPIPALAVDLSGANGAVPAADFLPHPSLRYLDLEQLSRTLRQNITLLKQGQTPAQLGLGETARQPGCENLLMLLYVQWCRAGTGRGEERSETLEPATVCFGIHAAHYQIGGRREFRQPGELTAREQRDLDTYGYILSTPHAVAAPNPDADTDIWQIFNRSASGFMCMLRGPAGKVRVAHNQLVAVRSGGSRQFQLGMVQWLRFTENDELRCGVRVFPGTPQAVAVRPSDFNPGNNRYERALLLPEVPATNTPASVVLPPGWFQSGRFIEIFSDRRQAAKLLNLLELGSDFDRCTITSI